MAARRSRAPEAGPDLFSFAEPPTVLPVTAAGEAPAPSATEGGLAPLPAPTAPAVSSSTAASDDGGRQLAQPAPAVGDSGTAGADDGCRQAQPPAAGGDGDRAQPGPAVVDGAAGLDPAQRARLEGRAPLVPYGPGFPRHGDMLNCELWLFDGTRAARGGPRAFRIPNHHPGAWRGGVGVLQVYAGGFALRRAPDVGDLKPGEYSVDTAAELVWVGAETPCADIVTADLRYPPAGWVAPEVA